MAASGPYALTETNLQSLAPFYYETGANAVREELLLLSVHDSRTQLDEAADARTQVLEVRAELACCWLPACMSLSLTQAAPAGCQRAAVAPHSAEL